MDDACHALCGAGERRFVSIKFSRLAREDRDFLDFGAIVGMGCIYSPAHVEMDRAAPLRGLKLRRHLVGVQSIHHLFQPGRFVTLLFSPTNWHGYTGSLLDRCVFILLIGCLPFIWRLEKSWCIWAFFLGVVPAVSGGFTSFTRFASVVFPLFVALGVYLSKPGMFWWRWLVLTTFVTLHLLLVWRFVNFRWAG